MLQQMDIELPHYVHITPTHLLEGGGRMPATADYYVPVGVSLPEDEYKKRFSLFMPTLEAVGNGAIRLSLEEPFGFTRESIDLSTFVQGDPWPMEQTQQTAGIKLAPLEPKVWQATFDTPAALTELDRQMFKRGIITYAGRAAERLRAR